MNPILLSPKIENDKSIPEQLQQMKSYLFQFKEQMELMLMNIDSDNLSEKFEDDFSKVVGSKIMGSKEMSQILQSAGQIKLQVEELDGNVASIALTTNGIYQQIYDPDVGILTELSLLGDSIAAAVKFGVSYTGFTITQNKFHIFSTGNLQIDTGNFIVKPNGDVEVKGSGKFSGTIEAEEGHIGVLKIGQYGLFTDTTPVHTALAYISSTKKIEIGSQDPDINYVDISAWKAIQFNADDIYCYGNFETWSGTTLTIGGDLECGGSSKSPVWKDIDTVIGTGEYVLCGGT